MIRLCVIVVLMILGCKHPSKLEGEFDSGDDMKWDDLLGHQKRIRERNNRTTDSKMMVYFNSEGHDDHYAQLGQDRNSTNLLKNHSAAAMLPVNKKLIFPESSKARNRKNP